MIVATEKVAVNWTHIMTSEGNHCRQL